MPVWRIAALAALALLALLPASALADSDGESTDRPIPQLELRMPEQTALGEEITVEAQLTDADGQPIQGATITFLSPASWAGGPAAEEEGHAEEPNGHQQAEGGETAAAASEEPSGHSEGGADGHSEGEEGHHGDFRGEMVLGAARTDPSGIASLTTQVRRSGEITITARFDGDDRYGAASASSSLLVEGSYQLYTPEVGIRIPGLGPWVLAVVIGVLWALYFVVALLVFAIARSPAASLVPAEAGAGDGAASASRRRFLTRLVVPLGMQAVIASIGLGLITLVARAPYTHGNLEEYTTRSRYRRTPFAPVGKGKEKEPMPPVLEREVSFTREVQPIFLTKAGPHAMLPDNSPPPAGVRLDSYEHIMEREGLVVPGRPEESELVSVLLNPAMRMPPSASPLSREEIQLIVSWIAQGAKYN